MGSGGEKQEIADEIEKQWPAPHAFHSVSGYKRWWQTWTKPKSTLESTKMAG